MKLNRQWQIDRVLKFIEHGFQEAVWFVSFKNTVIAMGGYKLSYLQ